MNRKWFLIPITLAFMAAILFQTATAAPRKGICTSHKQFETFKTTLQPGEWQTFALDPSAEAGAYFVDINPRDPSEFEAYIQHEIRPEFDGTQWVDMLRVYYAEYFPPVRVTIDVRCRTDLPLYMSTQVTLNPGDWQGYLVQRTNETGAFAKEVSPLTPSVPGAIIERYLIEPEQPWGIWYDVFRVNIPITDPPVEASLRLWAVHESALVVFDTTETLFMPEVWYGWTLAPASEHAAYVVEVSPVEETLDGTIQRYWVQTEHTYDEWIDVVRVATTMTENPMTVNIKVYRIDMR